MPDHHLARKTINRRRFLVLTAGSAGALAVAAACGSDDDPEAAPTMLGFATPGASPTTAPPAAPKQGTVMVGDVLDHALSSDEWAGDFGFVTFRLHNGAVDGEDAYFIRTDTSDADFADSEKLVYVPKMAAALDAKSGLSEVYLFQNGGPEQAAVLSTAPHKADYSPAFRVHRVTFTGSPTDLKSVQQVRDAEGAGALTVERTDIVVNYPVVKWPGGELPNDQKREAYLGDGQLLEPVDVAAGTVMFKLHSCYPSLRYIVTDVSLPPMAEGMHIAPAPSASGLTEAGATAKILVFGNGIAGSGPMKFQKSVTDTVLGDAAWSPYWDHYTFTWDSGATPATLKSEAEIMSRESQNQLKRFSGTPDTNGTLFMVNCPAPVVAPLA
jgi:hypothetical protein